MADTNRLRIASKSPSQPARNIENYPSSSENAMNLTRQTHSRPTMEVIVLESDSDDEVPLARRTRPAPQDSARRIRPRVISLEDDDDVVFLGSTSPLPRLVPPLPRLPVVNSAPPRVNPPSGLDRIRTLMSSVIGQTHQKVPILKPEAKSELKTKMDEIREDQIKEMEKAVFLKCAVCLSVADADTQLSSTTCGHIFCDDCIQNCLKNSQAGKKCPICRKTLGKNSVHKLFIS
jgi:hypothetical protein